MSVPSQDYEAWYEETISEEKGNRIVHYYLVSENGRPRLLAAVGIEKRPRHMVYTVSPEFVEAYGFITSVSARTKWTARREVVKWLISLVKKDHPPSARSGCDLGQNKKGEVNSSGGQKEEKFAQEEDHNKKNLGGGEVHQRIKSSGSGPGKQISATSEQTKCPKMKIKFSNNAPIGIQVVQPEPRRRKVADN